MYDLEKPIDMALFPGLQGGPHNHAIAGVGVALRQAKSPMFVEYQKKVIANAQHLSKCLVEKGYHIVTGGTDIHLILVNLKVSLHICNGNVRSRYIIRTVSIPY